MVEKFEFEVQGNAVQPYRVRFRVEGTNMTATCTCRAGQAGQHCKHRSELLLGVVSHLVHEPGPEFDRLHALLPNTDVWHRLQELAAAEQAIEAAKRKRSSVAKALSRAMRD